MDTSLNSLRLCQILSCEPPSAECIKLMQSFSTADWEDLYFVARHHNLILVLYNTLRNYQDHVTIPEALMVRLRQAYLYTIKRNLIILSKGKKLLTAIKDKNIPVIGLKGIFLFENTYQNIGLRSFYDWDLMVPKKQLQSTLRCLEDFGYRLSSYFDLQDINIDIKHIPPMLDPDGEVIEVHWTILEEYEPFSIDADGLWKRAVPVQIADVDVLGLGYEDLILHLCIHMSYQHHLEYGLHNLFDIYTVIKKYYDDIDWNLLIEIAGSWGAERVVWLTLCLMEEILRMKLPQDVLNGLLPEGSHPEIIEAAKEQLLSSPADMISMTPDLLSLSNKSGLFTKLKLIYNRIFIPKTALARIYNVPARSRRIYLMYGKRFIDLFKYYGRSTWRLMTKDPSAITVKSKLQTNIELVNWMAKRTSSSQSVFLKE